MRITRDEFLQWKAGPVGEEVNRLLNEEIELLKEEWAMGKFNNEIENAVAIGTCKGLKGLLELTYDKLKGDVQ